MIVLFWKRPAMEIVVLSGIAAILTAAVASKVFGVVGAPAGLWAFLIAALGILAGDLSFRRRQRMGLFSLRASTIFFVLPTWTIGAVLLLASILGFLNPTADGR